MKKGNEGRKRKESWTGRPNHDSRVLSIPRELLEEAGIPKDCDLAIHTVPGMILIRNEEPVRNWNQPVTELLKQLGIRTDQMEDTVESGGRKGQ